MKKSTQRNRRHRNPKSQEAEQSPSFFPKTNAPKVQAKEESTFFQAKLEISPNNDPSEKEADAVANKVIKGLKQQKATGGQQKAMINRMGKEEEPAAKLQRMGKEEEPAAKLQRMGKEEEPAAKLQRMGKEEEPAAKLQRMGKEEEPAAKLQRMGKEEEPAAKLQRMAKEEEPAAKLQVQAEAKPETKEKKKKEASTNLEQQIKATKGKGFALPNDIRVEMEAQFKVDFSQVRIHTDLEAVDMCQSIQAHAFTHGFDIYFNEGQYNPDTDTGKNLLAHELTHVVQQKGG